MDLLDYRFATFYRFCHYFPRSYIAKSCRPSQNYHIIIRTHLQIDHPEGRSTPLSALLTCVGYTLSCAATQDQRRGAFFVEETLRWCVDDLMVNNDYTFPETNTAPENGHLKMEDEISFLGQKAYFIGRHVSFRQGNGSNGHLEIITVSLMYDHHTLKKDD